MSHKSKELVLDKAIGNGRGKKNLLKPLKEAISGVEHDYTKGSLGRAIFLLSVPMVLEMLMESAFGLADIYFVSRIGPDAIAVVGITESLLTIVFSIGIGLSVAVSAVVARRIGEKKTGEASKSAFQGILTAMVASLPIAAIGVIFSEELLILMGLDESVAAAHGGYTALILGGNAIIMALFVNNAIFRSAGNPAIAMKVLWGANLINIGLDPCLIFGLGPFPELGVQGAAVATTIGRGIAVLFQFYLLYGGKSRIDLKSVRFKPDFKLIKKILALSAGSIGQFLIATASWVLMMKFVAKYGETAVAGYTIAIRLMVFALLPTFGISNAASTLVGQNLGAGEPDRAEKSVWYSGKISMIALGFFGALLIAFAPYWIGFFADSNPAVIQSGVDCLRILGSGFLFYGLGMVLVHAINGAGDTATPTLINVVCFWAIEIPLAYVLSQLVGLEQRGVYFSIVISETLLTAFALVVFRRGKWKTRQV